MSENGNQNNEQQVVDSSLFEMAKERIQGMKVLGIIVSIIIIIIGICLFVKPIATSSFFIWLFIIGLLIVGIERIVVYCKMPKGTRDGFYIATGILLIIVSIILLAAQCGAPFTTTASIQLFVAIMIGFTMIFSGIGRMCGSGAVAQMGGSAGAAICCGILELICGFIIIGSPLFGLLAIYIIFGIYLVVAGIALLISTASYKG